MRTCYRIYTRMHAFSSSWPTPIFFNYLSRPKNVSMSNQFDCIIIEHHLLTWEKYDGKTHLWSSSLCDWHRSRSSKRFSCIPPTEANFPGDFWWVFSNECWWCIALGIAFDVGEFVIILMDSWLSFVDADGHFGICWRL